MTERTKSLNRKERRAKRKIPLHLRHDFLSVEVPSDSGLKDGDRFTVKGHKRNQDGTLDRNCKEGEESVFIAVIRNHINWN